MDPVDALREAMLDIARERQAEANDADFDLGVDEPYTEDEYKAITAAVLEAAEIEDLKAELKRHRSANLVRAVVDGVDEEWITEAINAGDFDRIPWIVSSKLALRVREQREVIAGIRVRARAGTRESPQCDAEAACNDIAATAEAYLTTGDRP